MVVPGGDLDGTDDDGDALAVGHGVRIEDRLAECSLRQPRCGVEMADQRPQQFLSRLSTKHKILFVETVGPDPQLAAPYAWFRRADGFPNITILRIQFPTWQWGDGEFVDVVEMRLNKVVQMIRGKRGTTVRLSGTMLVISSSGVKRKRDRNFAACSE